jgi:ankyrin repeat protein
MEGRLEDLAELLGAGADPSVVDKQGFTPLHFAAQSLDPGAVRLLIDAGADIEARNVHGATPLLVALTNVRDSEGDAVRILLDAGADPDAANDAGVSPRSLAERVSNFDLLRFFRHSERGESGPIETDTSG